MWHALRLLNRSTIMRAIEPARIRERKARHLRRRMYVAFGQVFHGT